MIFGTVAAVPPTRERVQRSYLDVFIVGWFEHFVVSGFPHVVLQEIPFGGYQMHFEFSPYFLAWNSSTWDRTNVFDNVYATPPGSSTHISFGNADWVYKWAGSPVFGGCLNFQLQPNDNHYTAFALPTSSAPFWYKPAKTYPPVQQYNL